MNVKIRQAKLSDKNNLIPQIIIIEEQHAIYEDGKITEQTRQRVQEDLIRKIKKKKWWVAEKDKQVVGFVEAEIVDTNPDTVIIHNLFVKKEYRHQGIGTALVDFIEDLFKKKGVSKIRLWVARQNTEAEKLYQKLGFKFHQDIYKQYIKKI